MVVVKECDAFRLQKARSAPKMAEVNPAANVLSSSTHRPRRLHRRAEHHSRYFGGHAGSQDKSRVVPTAFPHIAQTVRVCRRQHRPRLVSTAMSATLLRFPTFWNPLENPEVLAGILRHPYHRFAHFRRRHACLPRRSR